MKNILTIVFLIVGLQCLGQTDTPATTQRDTSRVTRRIIKDTVSRQSSSAAVTDSLMADSARVDSASVDSAIAPVPVVKKAIPWPADTAFIHLITVGNFKDIKLQVFEGDPRTYTSKDELFYILAGLLLFMGIIKSAYPKYYNNTFRLIFQTSLRQKQTPEQIVQGYVPGFLLSLLFFMVGGVLIALFATQQNLLPGPLWLLILFCSGVLAVVYLVKYLVTMFAGWVFNVQDAAGMYSFVVFLVNRVMGIILLPLVILLAFNGGENQKVIFGVAAAIAVFLLLYRYALSLTVVRKNLKVSALHFFIYLCGVELMPLLVIYKVLFK